MRSLIFLAPVWFFALAALCIGVWRGGDIFGSFYVGLGVLGVCVANALMSQHRRIAELERGLELLRSKP
jgi:hypothetical protein